MEDRVETTVGKKAFFKKALDHADPVPVFAVGRPGIRVDPRDGPTALFEQRKKTRRVASDVQNGPRAPAAQLPRPKVLGDKIELVLGAQPEPPLARVRHPEAANGVVPKTRLVKVPEKFVRRRRLGLHEAASPAGHEVRPVKTRIRPDQVVVNSATEIARRIFHKRNIIALPACPAASNSPRACANARRCGTRSWGRRGVLRILYKSGNGIWYSKRTEWVPDARKTPLKSPFTLTIGVSFPSTKAFQPGAAMSV